MQTLLENDKDRVMAEFGRDRTAPAVQTVMEKELDRLSFQYMEAEQDDSGLEEASRMLTVMKNMISLLSSVTDVREWKQETPAAEKKYKPSAFLLLAAGIVLLFLEMLPVARELKEQFSGIQGIFFSVLPIAAMVCLLLSGYYFGKTSKDKKKGKTAPAAARKLEFLTDPDALWNSLHGVILLTDRYLGDVKASGNSDSGMNTEALGGKLTPETAELLSELLEAAYGKAAADPQDEAVRGMISEIRYFLHKNQIEVIDHSESTSMWFERLPGKYAGTLRPALVSGNLLIRKGLASG